MTLDIIFASTLTKEIGCQFSMKVRSFSFFSKRVMTARFWETPSCFNCSTWSYITETKGETTTIEHISDFIAASASRGKSWKNWRAEKDWIFGKSCRQSSKMEINSDSSKSLVQATLAIFLIDKMRRPPQCWQYCQNWPIRGYSSSCYTRRGSLKKFLQALPPLLALVLPPFFLACFHLSPNTESLEQAIYL